MGRFADLNVPDMTALELDEFEHLLGEPDPDLYDWIAGRTQPPANLIGPVLERLIGFKFAG
jgi:antitoxin CptB